LRRRLQAEEQRSPRSRAASGLLREVVTEAEIGVHRVALDRIPVSR